MKGARVVLAAVIALAAWLTGSRFLPETPVEDPAASKPALEHRATARPDLAASAPAAPLAAEPATPELSEVVSQMPRDEQASFRQALQHALHGIRPLSDSERAGRGDWQASTHHATHRGQDLMFDFQQDGGLRILPGREGASWQATLRLGGPAARDAGGWTADGTRAEYPRPGITEWYENRPEGLEHGFTVHQRPATAGKQGYEIPVVLGGLAVDKDPSRPGDLLFTDPASGTPVLGYQGLKVWDATGRALAAEMFPHGAGFHIAVNDTAAVYPVTIDPLIVSLEQTIGAPLGEAITYVKASNTDNLDFFGDSVAVDGDTIVVGAPSEDSEATGINGSQSNNDAEGSGAAYVFVRSGAAWSQQAYLKASNTGAGDGFGVSVAISGDTIVVGASGEESAATGINGSQSNDNGDGDGSGAAYVFVRSGSTWSQQAYLKASNTGAFDRFGGSVAISGNTIVVGADWEDSAATGINGNQGSNSAANSGAAYVFVRSGTNWSQQAYLKASNAEAYDGFGTSVAASGNTLVVGANSEDSAAKGINGNQNNNNQSNSGAAYVYVRSGTTWSQQVYLKASNTEKDDSFGGGVAISGNQIVVSAYGDDSNATGINGNGNDNSLAGAGAAYLFHSGGAAADDHFGLSVDLEGDVAVVAAPDHDHLGMQGSGKAWIFRRSGTSWTLEGEQILDEPAPGKRFGSAVAVSGDWLAVGADGDDVSGKTDCGSVSTYFRQADGIWASRGDKLFPAPSGSRLGRSVALDGTNLVAGAPRANGSGEVWTWDEGDSGVRWTWRSTGTVTAATPQADAEFGFSVALSGNRLIVGEPGRNATVFGLVRSNCGAVSFFRKRFNRDVPPDWPLVSPFNYTVANLGVGFSVAIDGDLAVAGNASPAGWFINSGASQVGSAYVYTYNGTIWTSPGSLDTTGLATGSYFGSAVAVENGVIAVGAFGNGVLTGRVRLFQQQGENWVTQQTLSHPSGESNNAFGRSLGLSNGRLLVGAYGADTGLIDVGQAYVYRVVDPDAVVPPLTLVRSGGNVILTWPATPGWSLWQSPSLGTGSWNPVTVVTDGSHTHPVAAAPRMFFRLQN
jgi:hypothetical protein